MALRRSRVRISLGPPQAVRDGLCHTWPLMVYSAQRFVRCAKQQAEKVTAGVVRHPVSEKGQRGGSPSPRPRERIRPNSPVTLHWGDCAGEFSSRRRQRPLSQMRDVCALERWNVSTRKRENVTRVVPRRPRPFVPEWKKGFFISTFHFSTFHFSTFNSTFDFYSRSTP